MEGDAYSTAQAARILKVTDRCAKGVWETNTIDVMILISAAVAVVVAAFLMGATLL